MKTASVLPVGDGPAAGGGASRAFPPGWAACRRDRTVSGSERIALQDDRLPVRGRVGRPVPSLATGGELGWRGRALGGGKTLGGGEPATEVILPGSPAPPRWISAPSACVHSLQSNRPRSWSASVRAKACACQGSANTGEPSGSRGIGAAASAAARRSSGRLKIALPGIDADGERRVAPLAPELGPGEAHRVEPLRFLARPRARSLRRRRGRRGSARPRRRLSAGVAGQAGMADRMDVAGDARSRPPRNGPGLGRAGRTGAAGQRRPDLRRLGSGLTATGAARARPLASSPALTRPRSSKSRSSPLIQIS